jgi:hypothetical protein
MSLLDELAGRFPEAPAAARLKAAVLFRGVRYDHALAEAADWAFPNYMPHHLPPGHSPFRGQMRVMIPYLLRMEDDTQVRLRIKEDSPFTLCRADGDDPRAFELLCDGAVIARTTFEPKLAWLDALTADGTPYRATGLSQHGEMLVMNVAPGCEYFVAPLGDGSGKTENLHCTFCLYGLPDKQRMEPLGQELRVVNTPELTLDRVIEAASHPDTRARQLYMVGGSLLDIEEEGARYLQWAGHLSRAGLTERYYVACGSGAVPKRDMERMRDLGVRGACFNMEVWDPGQFERICPGKAKFVGRARWIRALEEAVEVFGPDNVMTAFVGGAELDGEGAFEDPEAALASNVAAAEYLIPRGIQPVYSLFWKMTGKHRGDEPVYTLEYFLELNQRLAALRREHNRLINPDFFSRRAAYMQLEPDFDHQPP